MGEVADILVYVDQSKVSPADSFISGLPRPEKNKLDRYIQEFANRGTIRNDEKFKCEENPIFAFKAHHERVFCFFLPDAPKKTLVLTHGYSKKTQKISPRELKKAHQMYLEVIRAQAPK